MDGLVRDDPEAQEALLWSLAAVNGARLSYAGDVPFGDARPDLAVFSLATVAAILADTLDTIGGAGTAEAVLHHIYRQASPVPGDENHDN